MSIRVDPEGHETAAFFDLVPDLGRHRVLEVGCGDGRLTWRYAASARAVVAIDPDYDLIDLARQDLPETLRSKVELLCTGIEELYVPDGSFDLVLMSWAL